jgi:hypothetical protein
VTSSLGPSNLKTPSYGEPLSLSRRRDARLLADIGATPAEFAAGGADDPLPEAESFSRAGRGDAPPPSYFLLRAGQRQRGGRGSSSRSIAVPFEERLERLVGGALRQPALLADVEQGLLAFVDLGEGRCVYRMLHGLLKRKGWAINHKLVYRLYRAEGLTVRRRIRKRLAASRHLHLDTPARPDQRWSMDFVSDALADGAYSARSTSSTTTAASALPSRSTLHWAGRAWCACSSAWQRSADSPSAS